jgi:hypothetical protein
MKRIYLLYAILIAFAVLFSAAVVKAADDCTPLPPLPSLGVAAERSCTIKLNTDGTKNVIILAGPDAAEPDGLSKTFPKTCQNTSYPGNNLPDGPCKCDTSSQTCQEWQYKWTLNGYPTNAGLKQALISADSDVSVYSSNPAGASVLQPLIAKGERFIQYSVSGTNVKTFTGSISTSLNVTPGTLTAGFIGKSGLLPLLGRCGLAGPDNVTVTQYQAASSTRIFEVPLPEDCVVSAEYDSEGLVLPCTMKLVSGDPTMCKIDDCETQNKKLLICVGGGNCVEPIEPLKALEFVKPGSCSYCQTVTGGGTVCTTLKAYCINKATNRCVKASTLTTPATQCKAGTYTP